MSAAHREEQLAALERLWNVAQRDTGQSGVIARFLLGLYNGPRFAFDLTNFRRLDHGLMGDVFKVLVLDWQPEVEVHEHLNRIVGTRDMGKRFELLAYDKGMRQACTCAEARQMREAIAS